MAERIKAGGGGKSLAEIIRNKLEEVEEKESRKRLSCNDSLCNKYSDGEDEEKVHSPPKIWISKEASMEYDVD